jgi:hypothetical protein
VDVELNSVRWTTQPSNTAVSSPEGDCEVRRSQRRSEAEREGKEREEEVVHQKSQETQPVRER